MIAKKKAVLDEKILITGASGQLGYELKERLQERAIVKPREAMDVTDIWKVRDWLPVLRPDMIVHCAAYTDAIKAEREPAQCWATNALATHTLAVVAARMNCPLLFISSDMVFGAYTEMFDHRTPYGEKYPVGPLNVYGNSKAAAEYAVMQAFAPKDEAAACPYWILRTATLYERPWRHYRNFPQSLLQLVGSRTTMALPHDTAVSSTYVPHLADVIETIIENRSTFPAGVYHATNRDSCSLYELGRAFCAGVAKAPYLEPTTHDAYYRRQGVEPQKMPRYAVLMTKKLDDVLPKPMPTWREAIDEYQVEHKRLA